MAKKQKQKLIYEIVLTGRSLRSAIRNKQRKAKKGVLISPLGKMRSRQERKAMAKALKIPFNPRYNGPVFRAKLGFINEKLSIKSFKEVK